MMLQIVVQCLLNSWFNSYLDLDVSHRQYFIFQKYFSWTEYLTFFFTQFAILQIYSNFGAFRYVEMTNNIENNITSHISTFKINMPILTLILLQFWNLLKCSHPLCVINCNIAFDMSIILLISTVQTLMFNILLYW